VSGNTSKLTNRSSRIVCNSLRWNQIEQVSGAPELYFSGIIKTCGREDAPVELYQPDDDRTWKIEIMQANADGTIEPTDHVVEVARPD